MLTTGGIMPDMAIAVDDFEELEQALAERAGIAKPKGKPAQVDGFDELEELLSESINLKNEDARIKADRALLKRRGGVSAEDRAETEARVRAWEARRVWEALANVTVFEKHNCACGSVHKVFSHSMQQQRHREQPGTTRLIKTDEFLLNLPNLVAMAEFDVPMCADCAESKGVDITKEDFEW